MKVPSDAVNAVRDAAVGLSARADEFAAIVERLTAPFVLVGEAAHDTRAAITRQLIKQHGFSTVDETRALEPLETWAHDETGEPAETVPAGV